MVVCTRHKTNRNSSSNIDGLNVVGFLPESAEIRVVGSPASICQKFISNQTALDGKFLTEQCPIGCSYCPVAPLCSGS